MREEPRHVNHLVIIQRHLRGPTRVTEMNRKEGHLVDHRWRALSREYTEYIGFAGNGN